MEFIKASRSVWRRNNISSHMVDGDVFGITGFGVTGFGMMASVMIGALSVDAHAVLGTDVAAGAEHGADIVDAPALLE